jgi:putative flippase GtrA
MILGSLAGGDYVTLSFLAIFISTPLGYLLHARFTFRMRLSWRNFFRFASSIAAGFPVYFLSMAALCSGLHVAVAYAAPITTILLYVWNYGCAHWAMLGRSQWP